METYKTLERNALRCDGLIENARPSAQPGALLAKGIANDDALSLLEKRALSQRLTDGELIAARRDALHRGHYGIAKMIEILLTWRIDDNELSIAKEY